MLTALFPILATLIDRLLPDEEARAKAKLELLKNENAQALSEMQVRLSAILAEAQSADPWTSRARPSFLYLMYGILLLCLLGGIFGIWYPAEMQGAAQNVNALFKALPPDLYNLFALGYLGYTGARSFDKWKK